MLHVFDQLAVSADDVRANFARYRLLDDQVRFLVGWFRETLPAAPIERLAVLRLDGDLYESTMDALEALYDKVSPGGIVIVDDYGVLESCRAAVTDFRQRRGVTETIYQVDESGVHWQRRAG
jgi:O-methyltransferase